MISTTSSGQRRGGPNRGQGRRADVRQAAQRLAQYTARRANLAALQDAALAAAILATRTALRALQSERARRAQAE